MCGGSRFHFRDGCRDNTGFFSGPRIVGRNMRRISKTAVAKPMSLLVVVDVMVVVLDVVCVVVVLVVPVCVVMVVVVV